MAMTTGPGLLPQCRGNLFPLRHRSSQPSQRLPLSRPLNDPRPLRSTLGGSLLSTLLSTRHRVTMLERIGPIFPIKPPIKLSLGTRLEPTNRP